MSPVRHTPTPRRPLYRLGWLPDPLAWIPWEFVGSGRFDDPHREFHVLYAASQRRACFVEALAPFRPSLEVLAHLRQVMGSHEPLPTSRVPADWYRKRGVAQLRLLPRQRWLDLRAPATREALRQELASTLVALGLSDLDLSGVAGPGRALTQAIARWAYARGYAGLAYHSRFDETLTLWAIFERAAFEPVGVSEPITPDDADLAATAQLFGLVL